MVTKPANFEMPKYVIQHNIYQPTFYFFTQSSDKSSSKVFQSAKKNFNGGYLCNTLEDNKIFKDIGGNNYIGITSSQLSLLPQDNLKSYFLDDLLNPENFRQYDLMLADNILSSQVIEPLTDLPCKINKTFLFYILENLHCIIETGVLPPLNKNYFENIQEWVLFQRKVFVCEKCTLFTGKEDVRFTKNGIPQGLHKKLE